MDDLPRLTQMLAGANLIWTARDGDRLVGVARALSDSVYCTYLSDLAVDVAFQRQGIGKELMRQIKLQTPQAKLILLAAPAAIPYYPKVGFRKYEYCYMLDEVGDLAD
ncbi:MAG: GNAT family N-acetyltransferase [Bacteroidota bacterium]